MVYNINMILISHIIIALSGVFYSVYAFFYPTPGKIKIVYALIGLTALSGVLLIVQKPAVMQHVCISGLVYVGAMLAGVYLTRRRLAKN